MHDIVELAGELDDRWLALSVVDLGEPFGVAAQGEREESLDADLLMEMPG